MKPLKKYFPIIAIAIGLFAVITACSKDDKDDKDEIVTCTCTFSVSGFNQSVDLPMPKSEGCAGLTTQRLVDEGLLDASIAHMISIDCRNK